MKKTRRIEITAFRRTVTAAAAGPPASQQEQAPPTPEDGRRLVDGHAADISQSQSKPAEVVEAVLSSIDAESSPDFDHLIEVVESHDEGGEESCDE